MTINKLQALSQGTAGNSTGADVATEVNKLIDVEELPNFKYDATFYTIGANIDVSSTTNDTVTADRCTFVPVRFGGQTVINELAVNVNTGDTGAPHAMVGIYSVGTSGAPDVKLAEGVVDVSVAGVNSVSLGTPITLESGWYYTAFASAGTATVIKSSQFSRVINPLLGVKLTNFIRYLPYQTLSGGWTNLPATAGITNVSENYGPLVGVR